MFAKRALQLASEQASEHGPVEVLQRAGQGGLAVLGAANTPGQAGS